MFSNLNFSKIIALAAIVFCAPQNTIKAQTTTVPFSTTGATNWTVPPCVYEITVQVWGGGGGGGAAWSKFLNGCSQTGCQTAELCTAAGGGGGGGYASRTYSVQPGQVYNIVVGAGGAGGTLNASGTHRANDGSAGGTSSFSGPATVPFGTLTATGGAGGQDAEIYDNNSSNSMSGHTGNNGPGGSGGSGSNGTVNFTGGAGASGAHSSNSPDRSGGGGGGAGSTQNGSAANINAAGSGGNSGGGNGADGGYINNYVGAQFSGGNNGFIIGGGGSGALIHNRVVQNNSATTTTDRQKVGGNGERGEVRITYTTSPAPSLVSGFVNGEWAFHGTVDAAGTVTNVDWENSANWRVLNGSQFVLPTNPPINTSNVRLKSGTCLAQPTINSIVITASNSASPNNGSATCNNIRIESTGVLTINPDADVEHFHIFGDYHNSGTVNFANGRFKFINNGLQTIRDDDAVTPGMATFYEMNIGGTSLTQLINSTGVTILNALRINGVIQTNGNLFWLNTTAIDDVNTGVVTGAYSGHIFGTFRRTIQNNNATYRFPVGVGTTLNNDRRLLEYINNGVVGPSHLDCFATYPFKGSGNNVDSQLDPSKSTEWGQFLNFVHPEAIWTLTPSAAFISGSYGVRLYVQNFTNPIPQDNTFAVLKRPTASNTFFDFNAYENSTTIPNGGLPGRVYASGAGYAEKLGFTQFSEFVIASAPLPLSVELKEFKIICDSDNSFLSWSTVSEFNNDYYTVERSSTGSNFELVGTVEGLGSTSNEQNYVFTVKDPIRGINYYRLTQVDYDGQKEVLGVLSSEWPCSDQLNDVQIFPNPTEDDVNLLITRDEREEFAVQVYNSVGQSVIPSIQEDGKDQGSTLLKLRTNELPAGVYLIKVVVGEKVYTEKLVIN